MDISLKALACSLALVAFIAPVSAFAAEEEYYTWVDENGVTNYASKKPRGYEAAFVAEEEKPFGYRMPDEDVTDNPDARRPGAQAPAETPGGDVDPDALIAEEKEKIQAQLAKDKAFNCNVGKRNLTRLEAYGRVKIVDEDGESRFMTPAEMEEKKSESRKLITENCSA